LNVLSLCDEKSAIVPQNATVEDAVKVMNACHVGAVVVADDNGRLAGIFTERNVLVKFALSGRTAKEILVRDLMTTPAHTASDQISPGEALSVMIERHFRHLPIVDAAGRVLGILSIRDLLQWRADDLSHELNSLERYYSNDSLGG
jgi:CBS domain-containing protein